VAAQQTVQDRTTFVTFSGPVSVPGRTLPAGTYTFRLADSPSDRHIVQILDRDGGKLVATMLAVPAERAEAEGDPVITFKETPSERPPAVHYWYYAGERQGNELVYPKYQAMQIASASGESVMSVDTTSSDIEDWKKGQMSRVNGNAAPQSTTPSDSHPTSTTASTASTSTTAPTSSTTASTTSQEPTSRPQPATPQTTTPATTAPTTTPDTTAPQTTAPDTTRPQTAAPAASDRNRAVGTSGRSLPKTASELPAVGLIGLLALGAALTLRLARV